MTIHCRAGIHGHAIETNRYLEGIFEALSPNASLVERTGEQLESLILNGLLPPGERLPTERRLGGMFGVSRTVVRESMRLLAASWLVKVTSGSGTYVQAVGQMSFAIR